MTVYDLNRDQLVELKQQYLTNFSGEEPSYEELANADEIITDEQIYRYCEDITFTPDDFFCSAGQDLYQLVVDGADGITIDDIIEDLEYIKNAVIRGKHDGRAPHGSSWELERWN